MRIPTLSPLLSLILLSLMVSHTCAQGPPAIKYAIPGSAGSINAVKVSFDGTYIVSGSADGTVKQLSYPDGILMHTWSLAPYAINSVAISYDSKTIAFSSTDNKLELRSAADGSLLKEIATQSNINSVSISRDGTDLAAGAADGNIYVYSVLTGETIKILRGHTAAVNSVAFAQYNLGAQLQFTLASGSTDGTVRLWNLASNALARLNVGATVNAVDIWAANPPNDLVYAACSDGTVRIWAIETKRLQQTLSFDASVLTLGVDGVGGDLAIGVADDTVHLEMTKANSTQYATDTSVVVEAQPYAVHCTYGASDVVVGLSDNALQRYTQSLDLAGDLFFLTAPLEQVLPSPDGTQMTVALNSGVLDQFALSDGSALQSLPGYRTLAYSPDGKQIFCQGTTGWETVEVETGEILRTWSCQPSTAAFLSDGKTLATWSPGSSGQLQLWNLTDGRLLQTYNSLAGTSVAAFSPDGSLLAEADPSGHAILYVYQTQTNAKKWNVNFNLSYDIQSIAWSKDGSLLVAQTGDPANSLHTWLYGIVGAAGLGSLAPPPGNAYGAFAVSPYADVIAAYRTSDNALDVWHVHDDTVTFFDSEMGAGLNTLAFSPDASTLLLGRADGTLLAAYNPYPISLAAFTITPSLVTGGKSVTGRVTLSQPAPAGGVEVQLTANNLLAISFPSTLLVPAGQTAAIFTIETASVTDDTQVTLSASYDGRILPATLQIEPDTAVQSLTLLPATVIGSDSGIGIVTLVAKAGSNGIVVPLSSSDPDVVVPATVTVPAGKRNVFFSILTGPVNAVLRATLSASHAGTIKTATLTVEPISVASISLTPGSITSNDDAIGAVFLTAPAPEDVVVILTSSNTTAAQSLTGSITIPAGQMSGLFSITSGTVSATTNVIFTASYNGSARAILTVTP